MGRKADNKTLIKTDHNKHNRSVTSRSKAAPMLTHSKEAHKRRATNNDHKTQTNKAHKIETTITETDHHKTETIQTVAQNHKAEMREVERKNILSPIRFSKPNRAFLINKNFRSMQKITKEIILGFIIKNEI